jgi:tRNA-specific 2-thiouridylase
LALADKPDSADICFVPDGDYRSFVRRRLPQRQGAIEDADGAAIGTHDGVAGFTIGQRRGIGVAVGERRFVTAIDPDRNVVTVGVEDDLLAPGLIVEDVRWVAGAPPGDLRADVKIRYRARAAAARVSPQPDGTACVTFDSPQRAVTPGQAAVFYDGDEVLGGGTIAMAARA